MLTLDCIAKGYLQSSQRLISELFIHLWRHSWWTYFNDPEQKQGAIKGMFCSVPQWQILQKSSKLKVEAAVVKLSMARLC